jgi:hypothetical protein
MKKQQALTAKPDLIQKRPNEIHTVSTAAAPFDVVAVVLPAGDGRHDAGTGFKRLQDMLRLEPPRAGDDDLLRGSGPIEIRDDGPGPA